MNILFVCTGNMSRSFLAEVLFRREIKSLGMEAGNVSSAGLYAYPGNPADPDMVDYLKARGIAVPRHEARQMTREDAAWADRILVMEKAQAETIERLWPEAKDKVQHLGQYIAPGQKWDDIMDPFGKTPYHYRLAQSQITLAVASLACVPLRAAGRAGV